VKALLRIELKAPGKNDLRPDPMITMMGNRPIPSAYLRWKGIERQWRRALPAPRPEQNAGMRRIRRAGTVSRPINIPEDATIDTVTAEQWRAACRCEREDFMRKWQARGIGCFVCTRCGFPSAYGCSSCEACS
jgi:hypothetical protein